MVGQEHVLRALVNALDNDRLHHAYLFTGTRGVGKTTVARIFAKSLNCEQGVSSTPCGECAACTEIDEGRFVDLIEVDAASRTKVDETRELLENVPYAPTQGRYKVYLIDEVHMFSKHSFNALLKTLEEPPPHVKFLLATTDPQKLPVTILSRCLQFNLRRLAPELIREHLGAVLAKEGIESEPAALAELARAADGSMRDALSLLDQAIAFGGGAVREAEVRAMLGTIERGQVQALLRALAAGDGAALLECVEGLSAQAPDYGEVLGELLGLLQRVAVAQAVPGALDDSEGDGEMVREFAAALSPEDVQLFYQIGLIGRRDLPHAPDPRGGLEMILLRMLAFRPVTGGAARPAPAAPGGGMARPPADEAGTPPAPKAQPATDWQGMIEAMGLKGMVRQLAENCTLAERSEDKVVLGLDPEHRSLLTPTMEKKLAEALATHLGGGVQVQIHVGEAVPAETPARRAAREAEERQQAAEAAIAGDENLRALEETFGARVEPGSVRPLD